MKLGEITAMMLSQDLHTGCLPLPLNFPHSTNLEWSQENKRFLHYIKCYCSFHTLCVITDL